MVEKPRVPGEKHYLITKLLATFSHALYLYTIYYSNSKYFNVLCCREAWVYKTDIQQQKRLFADRHQKHIQAVKILEQRKLAALEAKLNTLELPNACYSLCGSPQPMETPKEISRPTTSTSTNSDTSIYSSKKHMSNGESWLPKLTSFHTVARCIIPLSPEDKKTLREATYEKDSANEHTGTDIDLSDIRMKVYNERIHHEQLVITNCLQRWKSTLQTDKRRSSCG